MLNAAIVSKSDGLGTFVATFVNTSQTQPISLTSMAGDGTEVGQITVEPLPIDPKSLVNLATEGGIAVEGTYRLGQFVTLSIGFDNGETATLSSAGRPRRRPVGRPRHRHAVADLVPVRLDVPSTPASLVADTSSPSASAS